MSNPGFVYLMRAENGEYKIGRSIDPANRSKTVKREIGQDVNIIHVIGTMDNKALERELHKLCAGTRAHGEWFLLTSEQIEMILSWPSDESISAPEKTTDCKILVRFADDKDVLYAVTKYAETIRNSRNMAIIFLLQEALKAKDLWPLSEDEA